MNYTFLCALLLMVPEPTLDEWKFDVLHVKSGQSFPGLIASEGPERIVFTHILRKPGARTVTREMVFEPAEIERIDRLGEEDRKHLRRKLNQLDETGEQEKLRAAAVTFTKKPWPGSDQPALHFVGKQFDLTSNAEENTVRMVVVRLEEVFTAYVANLGVRRQPKERTKVVLYRSVQEYQQWQKRRGLSLLNAAYYDAVRNEIHIASDLERLETDLTKVRDKQQTQLQELIDHEKKLRKHYHGKPPAASLAQLRSLRRHVQALGHENDAALERLRSGFFATLRHEAFHAYLDAYVYPEGEGVIPRWLNEGLAQIFETAVVETGELRVGHIDPQRLTDVQTAVKQKELVPLRDLVRSTPNDFRVAHASEAWASDRFFLSSWALAYYLTFERKLLGTEALHQYVRMQTTEEDKVHLLERLVGQPLADLEKEFHAYLFQLRPDGTLKKPR